MLNTNIGIDVKGHVKITDDLGNVLLDQCNAVHPQNMSRVIARALSNESNYYVNRIAFGNGGTTIDAAFNITFQTPNDGQPPDTLTWESRLYNETYSEIVDDSNSLIGTDPGSAGPQVGTRPGGGADPTGDPISVEHVSGPGTRSRELGLTSEVLVVAVLNPNEPKGQYTTDTTVGNIDSTFTFDELGIYTTGLQAAASAGSQDVDVSNKKASGLTGLTGGVTYSFSISVDGSALPSTISVTPPNNNTTFGELCDAINDPSLTPTWIVVKPVGGFNVSITDDTNGVYTSITNAQTYGFLRFVSQTSGSLSDIIVTDVDLFATLGGTILPAKNGSDKGVQNKATDSNLEQERLLTHLIFAPVIKTANRTLTIAYTLTISVARTQQVN